MNANTALLLIDIQQGLDDPCWGNRNNPDAETNMCAVLTRWRSQGWPVIHIQHCSTEAGSPLRPDCAGVAFKPATAPVDDEPIIQKQVNSAFIGTNLETMLRKRKLDSLVVVGLTTDHCVSTTVRVAANKGFSVILVGDATATFDRTAPDGAYIDADTMHTVSLASLNREFCTVAATRDLLGNGEPSLADVQ